MTLGVHCVVFEVGEGAVPESVLERLARDPRIGSAQRMNEFRVLGTDPYRPLQKSLDLMQIGVTHGDATGRNVRVAVIDTGVDLRHPDLAGQVIRSGDFAPAATTAFEEDIHGTAVAGVIAARTGNAEGIAGVAPGARLEVYRACWPDRPSDTAARCDTLSLARALDTVARTRPQVLNLSLTGPRDGLIGALVRAVLDRGVIIVAAVPEDGGESFIGPFPQVIRARTGLGDAATEEGADFLAPGQDVLTTFPHGTYNFISGNSFAAANVTGIVALLMEGRPRLSATELRPLLRGSTGHAPPASVSGARRGCGSLRPALRQRACGTPVHGQLASTTSDF
ncbi:MAG: S8 family serine peptidase [Gammaproteobacteria bacterium]